MMIQLFKIKGKIRYKKFNTHLYDFRIHLISKRYYFTR